MIAAIRRTPRTLEVVVDGHLTNGTRETYGQFSARIIVTEKHVGYCISRLDAKEPRFDDRITVVCCPRDRQRPAIHQHKHNRFTDRADGLQEIFLISGEIEI